MSFFVGRQPLTCRAGGGAQNPKGAALTESPKEKCYGFVIIGRFPEGVKPSGAFIGHFLYDTSLLYS